MDLDRGTATLAESITGKRHELSARKTDLFKKYHLGQLVYVKGFIEAMFDRRGGVQSKVEVETIDSLENYKSTRI